MKVLGLMVTTAMAITAPAVAQTELAKPECNKANIASTQEKVAKMKDGEQKKTAANEIATATEMLAKGRTEDCQVHLLKATVQTK